MNRRNLMLGISSLILAPAAVATSFTNTWTGVSRWQRSLHDYVKGLIARRDKEHIINLARRNSMKAVEDLIDLMNDPTASDANRIAAANIILINAYGDDGLLMIKEGALRPPV